MCIAFATRLVLIYIAYFRGIPTCDTAFFTASGIEMAAPAKLPLLSLKNPSTILIFQPSQPN